MLGLPISPDNAAVVVPDFIASTQKVIESGVAVLADKFAGASKGHACSFPAAGGRKHDCHRCLARFRLDADFKRVDNSYRLAASADRQAALLGAPLGKDKDAALERPCSWLTAVMRYAGSGERAFARMKKSAALVAAPKQDSLLGRMIAKLSP